MHDQCRDALKVCPGQMHNHHLDRWSLLRHTFFFTISYLIPVPPANDNYYPLAATECWQGCLFRHATMNIYMKENTHKINDNQI
jgi:hypothetical protein